MIVHLTNIGLLFCRALVARLGGLVVRGDDFDLDEITHVIVDPELLHGGDRSVTVFILCR